MLRLLCAVMLAVTALRAAAAGDAAPPSASIPLHMGVASCAGSSCHGATRPFAASKVRQDEYFTWQRRDAHSNAYQLLSLPLSQRIAANLDLKDPQQAPECLNCHSDSVAAEQRGSRYQLTDGVGCEACHGGAEHWLASHANGSTHGQNLAAGLRPLDDPAARAQVCLGCHYGSTDKPIDHRIMGAGHPPLEFELAFFTEIEPAHFVVDDDYRAHKAHPSRATTWATGQLVAAQRFLADLQSPRFDGGGLFPELVFFDCNACHHAMEPPRWNAGIASPLGPGEVRLADASLILTRDVLAVLAPGQAAEWSLALSALHRSSQQSRPAVARAAARLGGLLDQALPLVSQRTIDRQDALALLQQIARAGIERDAGNFSAAKQIYYAVDALRLYLAQDYGLHSPALDRAGQALFAAVDIRVLRPDQPYDPEAVRRALRDVQSALQLSGH